MKFLILGANFKNKGAQAMLFTATSELKNLFPNCDVFFMTKETPQTGYEFMYLYDLTGWDFLKGGISPIKAVARVFYHKLKGREIVFGNTIKFIKTVKNVDAFIDISGYALSSQRGVSRSISFLNQIRIAKRLNIPYFVMPQSIGPFDYGKHQKKMNKLLKQYLSYPVKIFAREEDGYILLKEDYGLKNVDQSYDLVLQNKGITLNNVINNEYHKPIPELESKGNVAIVPNEKNFAYGSQERYKELYWQLIKRLQHHNKTVYLIRHSKEDLDVCHMIFDGLKDRQGVFLLEDDFDCIQFNGFVQQMDYIIGSRYHGIVHSFKNTVPAIVLGWATKYRELLCMFNQERYLFDVREEISIEALLNAVDQMEGNWQKEKQIIATQLVKYQQDNCFSCIYEYFKQ